jgi:hypothetical protein
MLHPWEKSLLADIFVVIHIEVIKNLIEQHGYIKCPYSSSKDSFLPQCTYFPLSKNGKNY